MIASKEIRSYTTMTIHREEPSMSRRDALWGGLAGAVLLTGASTARASPAQEASRKATRSPLGAFVYTELQVSIPFGKEAWRERNPILLAQPGLINKTWLA